MVAVLYRDIGYPSLNGKSRCVRSNFGSGNHWNYATVDVARLILLDDFVENSGLLECPLYVSLLYYERHLDQQTYGRIVGISAAIEIDICANDTGSLLFVDDLPIIRSCGNSDDLVFRDYLRATQLEGVCKKLRATFTQIFEPPTLQSGNIVGRASLLYAEPINSFMETLDSLSILSLCGTQCSDCLGIFSLK